MSNILFTDYSSRICIELYDDEPNFIFYFISLIFVVIYMCCGVCIAAYWQLFCY